MKREKEIRVYFQIGEQFFQLFNALYFVTEGLPEFKFSGFSDFVIVNEESNSLSEDGVMNEDDFAKSIFSKRSELTYHKDGSMLKKTPDNPSGRIHTNPYGKDVRWTPPCDVKTVQPVFYICIRRVEIYKPSSLENRKDVANYICNNEELFSTNGSYLVLFFLKNKNFDIARFTTPDSYSDIVYSGVKETDMCISIIRHSFPKPQPYQSKYFGHAIITPYSMNSYNFCKKYDNLESFMGKDITGYLKRTNLYMLTLFGPKFRRVSKEEMLIIELSELLYEKEFRQDSISKALIVKTCLKAYENIERNSCTYEGKKKAIQVFFNLFCAIPQYKGDILRVIESEKSSEQKIEEIIMIASNMDAKMEM